MSRTVVEVEREYGPFSEHERVNGVTFDGDQVWFATGQKLQSLDPKSGKLGKALDVACEAGTAFDGKYLFQLAGGKINKLDPHTGRILASIPAPSAEGSSGMAWAEGSLWVGRYGDRKVLELDPDTGKVLSTITSDRFVTGVTFDEGELWHATLENDQSELRRVDRNTSEVLETLALPAGVKVSGLESDGKGRFFCGSASSSNLRVVKRPKRA